MSGLLHERVEQDAADADGATDQLDGLERLLRTGGRGGAARRGIHGKVHQAAWAQGRTWKAMAEPTMTMARLAVLATD